MINTIKVGLLLAALTALFVWIGNLLGGQAGMIIALVLAAAMNFGSYWFSDRLVLAATRAQPVDPSRAPELQAMVEKLAQRAEIPTPRLFVVPDPTPNAFATGRSPQHGVVAVNQGLLDNLDREEVQGVIAHEIAHIKNRDTLTMAIAATLAGGIMMVANILQFAAMFAGGGDEDRPNPLALLAAALLAPLGAALIQSAVSRSREYEADRVGAELAGSAKGLARALQRLDMILPRMQETIPMNRAHMYIHNPLSGRGLSSLFSTHPSTEDRIKKLMDYDGGGLDRGLRA